MVRKGPSRETVTSGSDNFPEEEESGLEEPPPSGSSPRAWPEAGRGFTPVGKRMKSQPIGAKNRPMLDDDATEAAWTERSRLVEGEGLWRGGRCPGPVTAQLVEVAAEGAGRDGAARALKDVGHWSSPKDRDKRRGDGAGSGAGKG